MKKIIVIALLLYTCFYVYGQLTYDQAKKYIEEHPEEAIQDIMRLDRLERAEPELEVPGVALLLTDEYMYYTYADTIKLNIDNYLSYEITLEPIKYKRFDKPDIMGYIVVSGASLLIGYMGGIICGP